MIYDISMPRPSFDTCMAIVEDVTERCKPRYLRMVTQDINRLSWENQQYIEKAQGAPLAVTFFNGDEFDIWFTSAYTNWSGAWAIDTVLHELVHGLGGQQDHGFRFRKMLGTALHTYEDLVAPIHAGYMTSRMVDRYSTGDWNSRQREKRNAKSLVS